jgi:hypothetical protein
MLEEAQQRISELERNIADIKEINSKKTAALPTIDPAQYGIVFGVLALIGIFLYGVFFRSKPDEPEVVKHQDPQVSHRELLSPQNLAAVTTPSIMDQKNRDDFSDDTEVNISSAAVNAAEQAIPKNVEALFSSIDLNLVPAAVNPTK